MIAKPKIVFEDDPRGGYRLTAEMLVELPRPEVFEFFADAMELERITPPWLNFSVLTEMPVEMRGGLLLDYKLHIHRIPIYWRTEIALWEPPYRFVDQQLRGPYKRWYHEHTFEETDHGTLVRDEVHYIPRGGKLLHRLMVRPDLEKIFTFRQDTLRKIFDEKIAMRDQVEVRPQNLGLPTETSSEFHPRQNRPSQA